MFSAAAQIRGICMYIVLFLAKDSGTIFSTKICQTAFRNDLLNLFTYSYNINVYTYNCMVPGLPTLFVYLKYSVYVLCVQPAVFPYEGHVKVPFRM